MTDAHEIVRIVEQFRITVVWLYMMNLCSLCTTDLTEWFFLEFLCSESFPFWRIVQDRPSIVPGIRIVISASLKLCSFKTLVLDTILVRWLYQPTAPRCLTYRLLHQIKFLQVYAVSARRQDCASTNQIHPDHSQILRTVLSNYPCLCSEPSCRRF